MTGPRNPERPCAAFIVDGDLGCHPSMGRAVRACATIEEAIEAQQAWEPSATRKDQPGYWNGWRYSIVSCYSPDDCLPRVVELTRRHLLELGLLEAASAYDPKRKLMFAVA